MEQGRKSKGESMTHTDRLIERAESKRDREKERETDRDIKRERECV